MASATTPPTRNDSSANIELITAAQIPRSPMAYSIPLVGVYARQHSTQLNR